MKAMISVKQAVAQHGNRLVSMAPPGYKNPDVEVALDDAEPEATPPDPNFLLEDMQL